MQIFNRLLWPCGKKIYIMLKTVNKLHDRCDIPWFRLTCVLTCKDIQQQVLVYNGFTISIKLQTIKFNLCIKIIKRFNCFPCIFILSLCNICFLKNKWKIPSYKANFPLFYLVDELWCNFTRFYLVFVSLLLFASLQYSFLLYFICLKLNSLHRPSFLSMKLLWRRPACLLCTMFLLNVMLLRATQTTPTVIILLIYFAAAGTM